MLRYEYNITAKIFFRIVAVALLGLKVVMQASICKKTSFLTPVNRLNNAGFKLSTSL
jgi:hypothetical protein